MVLSSLCFAALLLTRPIQDMFFFCRPVSTIFGVSFYALSVRLTLIRKLKDSRVQFAESADRIAAINRDVSSIMENIQLGVFTIESADGRLGDQHSQAPPGILGFELKASHKVFDILQCCDLPEDRLAQVRTVIGFIGDDSIAFQMNSGLLPQECSFRRPGG